MADPTPVLGYLFTHWTCDACGLDHEQEGDVSGESFDCDQCSTTAVVQEVR